MHCQTGGTQAQTHTLVAIQREGERDREMNKDTDTLTPPCLHTTLPTDTKNTHIPTHNVACNIPCSRNIAGVNVCVCARLEQSDW